MARNTILDHYMSALTKLREQPSSSLQHVSVSVAFQRVFDGYIATFPVVNQDTLSHAAQEVDRRYITSVLYRLKATSDTPHHPEAYPDASHFINDMTLRRDNLAAHAGLHLSRRWLDPLIREIETFGFHLYTLDIRQHARVHAQAVQELAAGAQGGLQAETRAVLNLPDAPSAADGFVGRQQEVMLGYSDSNKDGGHAKQCLGTIQSTAGPPASRGRA